MKRTSSSLIFILTMLAMTSQACSIASLTGQRSEEENAGQPAETVLFQDDFSDPSSGWDRIRDEDGITDYQDGAYRFLINKSNWLFWSNPNLNFTDVRVEVDATKNGGPDLNEFGVICRYRDSGNFYFLTVSSDGYYGISKLKDGEESLVDMDAQRFNEAIQQGEGTNHIRAECVGDRLTLYVNGRILAEVTDSDFTSGDVGLIVGSFEEPGVDILFSNFSVMRP